jgi:hypothetical protein
VKFIGAGARPGRPQVDHDRVFTIPNLLTVVRFMGVPLFIWLVLGQKEYGAGVIVLAVMAERTGSTATSHAATTKPPSWAGSLTPSPTGWPCSPSLSPW